MKNLFFLLAFAFLPIVAYAQRGIQLGVNGQASISSILNQNNYGDPTGFEPSYVITKGYDVNIKAGYNFIPYVGLFVTGGRTWAGQDYADQNRFGKHKKQVDLSYYYAEVLFRYNPILERNQYKTKQKIRTELKLGFRLSSLTTADVQYQLNGSNRGYPFRIPEFGYEPVADDKELFRSLDFGFIAKIGINWYITERLYLDPGVRMYVGLLDINSEKYSVHDNYNASRNFAAGIHVGINYYITYLKK